MQTYYLTFGQAHAHAVEGKTFDRDCVAVVKAATYEDARKTAFETFVREWCMIDEELPDLAYYPRGLIEL